MRCASRRPRVFAVEDMDRIPDCFFARDRGYVDVKYDPTDIRKQKRKEFHVAPEFPKLAPCQSFEARRFKTAQARRCPRPRHLFAPRPHRRRRRPGLVLCGRVAADIYLTPSQGPAIPRHLTRLEVVIHHGLLSRFSPTKQPSCPLHKSFTDGRDSFDASSRR